MLSTIARFGNARAEQQPCSLSDGVKEATVSVEGGVIRAGVSGEATTTTAGIIAPLDGLGVSLLGNTCEAGGEFAYGKLAKLESELTLCIKRTLKWPYPTNVYQNSLKYPQLFILFFFRLWPIRTAEYSFFIPRRSHLFTL